MDKRIQHSGLKVTASLIVTVFFSACTVIKITDPEGHVSVVRSFGLAKIIVEPDHGTSVTDVRSLGFVLNSAGSTLGYYAGQLVVSADDCVLVIWAESAAALDPYRELLEQPYFCTAIVEKGGS